MVDPKLIAQELEQKERLAQLERENAALKMKQAKKDSIINNLSRKNKEMKKKVAETDERIDKVRRGLGEDDHIYDDDEDLMDDNGIYHGKNGGY